MDEFERKEYLDALEELNQALRNLNNAEPNYVEIAVLQLKAAQDKVDAFINARR